MISVIAPVYNVEKFLPQFFESILNQTYKDFELLIIDDCGTDRSSEICKEYEKKYRQVRVIKQPCNGGLPKARNRGMAEAKGDYIMFVDSDDYLAPQALEKCMTVMEQTNADIVFGGFAIDCLGKITIKKYRFAKRFYDLEEAIRSFLNVKTLYGYACGKLYKKEVLELGSDPEDMRYGEDGVFSYRALTKAKHGVAFITDPIYYYRIRDNSLSNHGQDFDYRNLDTFKQVMYITQCTDIEKFREDLNVFIFSLFQGEIKKYLQSSVKSKNMFIKEYQKMDDFCRKNWKSVLLNTINPRIKVTALKYKLFKI